VWTAGPDAENCCFEISGSSQDTELSVQVDSQTGVPENEKQPPHGAIRWNLVAPMSGQGTVNFMMQWIYDAGQIHFAAGGC
jgi:hypothetical protein